MHIDQTDLENIQRTLYLAHRALGEFLLGEQSLKILQESRAAIGSIHNLIDALITNDLAPLDPGPESSGAPEGTSGNKID
jgi:hypothetical protein